LHTTSNALLFLVLAALATMNGRVEDAPARTATQAATRDAKAQLVEFLSKAVSVSLQKANLRWLRRLLPKLN
jgi:hypothetical protein